MRELQTLQLKLLRESKGLNNKGVDVFLSHDWPRGIARYGDMRTLLRKKQFLRREIETNTLGSPPGEELLHLLRPTYWFAAHMHVKFSAVVKHNAQGSKTTKVVINKCVWVCEVEVTVVLCTVAVSLVGQMPAWQRLPAGGGRGRCKQRRNETRV